MGIPVGFLLTFLNGDGVRTVLNEALPEKLAGTSTAAHAEAISEIRIDFAALVGDVSAEVGIRLRSSSGTNGSGKPAIHILSEDDIDDPRHTVRLIAGRRVGDDFDGGGGVEGWNDASETFSVTLELVRRGYTKKQIEKIWSGNLLRVLDEVQKIAKRIQADK